jgi:hypothetical protein
LTETEKDEKAPALSYQRITPNPSTEDLGKSSGAPIDPDMYSFKLGESKDDVVTFFRRMLDLGTPEYEHELAEFLHNGPPKLRYEAVKTKVEIDTKAKPVFRTSKTWTFIDHADPETRAKEAEYFEEQRKEKERHARIADKLKTLVVTKKEDLALDIRPNGKFDFQCYTIDCEFVTNNKADYERHVVTKHYGKGLCYPGKIDIKMRGWTAQGRTWEI